MEYRIEKDNLGEKQVPVDRYWGIHTQRALENFSFTGQKVPDELIRAIVMVKRAACLANQELGYLPAERAQVILTACEEALGGKLSKEWPLDQLQGGAGTSTNMNVNEVLANRANELLGGAKGVYDFVKPIEDVNLHQSTNDVYPTALRIAVILELKKLSGFIAKLQGVFQSKEKEFSGVAKIGRTEMQEAVPMTMGAEFSAFAEAVGRDRWRTFKCEERLRLFNLGGTAVGTGLGAPRSYIFLVSEKLREVTGLAIGRGENLVDLTANADVFVEVSGILKAHAVNLMKISNDLRLLVLFGEIILPAVQAGSSIMPGKVNPVILESVIQAGARVTANDAIVTDSAARGTLQINEFLPQIALALLDSLKILGNACGALLTCVDGVQANAGKCREYLDNSPTIVTAFLPEIGYEKAGEVFETFKHSGRKDLRRFLAEKLGQELVDRVLSPQALNTLGYNDRAKHT